MRGIVWAVPLAIAFGGATANAGEKEDIEAQVRKVIIGSYGHNIFPGICTVMPVAENPKRLLLTAEDGNQSIYEIDGLSLHWISGTMGRTDARVMITADKVVLGWGDRKPGQAYHCWISPRK